MEKPKEKQMELFEDQRILQLDESDRWKIYENPTKYEETLNDMTYQIDRILKEKK